MEITEVIGVYDQTTTRTFSLSTDINLGENTQPVHFANPVPLYDASGTMHLGYVTVMSNSPASGNVDAEVFLRYGTPERLDLQLEGKGTLEPQVQHGVANGPLFNRGLSVLRTIRLLVTK